MSSNYAYAEKMQHKETPADKRSESRMLMTEESPIKSVSYNQSCKLDECTRPIRSNTILY